MRAILVTIVFFFPGGGATRDGMARHRHRHPRSVRRDALRAGGVAAAGPADDVEDNILTAGAAGDDDILIGIDEPPPPTPLPEEIEEEQPVLTLFGFHHNGLMALQDEGMVFTLTLTVQL